MEINGKPLSAEQLALFKALTRLQQGVALGVLGGLSQRESYLQAGGKSQGSNADVAASQTLRLPKVRAFLDSFRAEEAQRLADVVMSRDEMAGMLSGMARNVQEGPQARLGACKQLAAMLGYDAPVKVESNSRVSHSMTLADFYGDLTHDEIAATLANKRDDENPVMALMGAQLDKAGF